MADPVADPTPTPVPRAPAPINIPPATVSIPNPGPSGGAIYQFANSGLQKSITEALAGIEPGHHVAVVAYVDKSGDNPYVVHGAAMAKIDDHWSLVTAVSHDLGQGNTDFQAAVRWSI